MPVNDAKLLSERSCLVDLYRQRIGYLWIPVRTVFVHAGLRLRLLKMVGLKPPALSPLDEDTHSHQPGVWSVRRHSAKSS